MARTPRPNLNLASEVLQHTQALIDGAIKAPSDLDGALLRAARKSQSSGPLAHQYKSSVEFWERSEKARLEALVVEQSSQEEIDAAQTHWQQTKQAMEAHPDLAPSREAVTSAEVVKEDLISQREEAEASVDGLWREQRNLPWYKKMASSNFLSAFIASGSPPRGLTGWVAAVLKVDALGHAIVSAKKHQASFGALIKQSDVAIHQAYADLQKAKETHPDYVSADQSLRDLLVPHAQLKTARINASSVSESAYDAIGRTLKSRWSHPDFQALARAVSQLPGEAKEKLRERIEKVYPQDAEIKEAWRSRNAGSSHALRVSAPLASTQSASSDPFMGTALWWMMINSNSTVFQSPLNTQSQDFLSDFARHSCIEPEHSHQAPHSHAGDNAWAASATPSHSPSHDYASPSPSYDHSPPPSYDPPSPSPSYDSSSSSFSSGGDF